MRKLLAWVRKISFKLKVFLWRIMGKILLEDTNGQQHACNDEDIESVSCNWMRIEGGLYISQITVVIKGKGTISLKLTPENIQVLGLNPSGYISIKPNQKMDEFLKLGSPLQIDNEKSASMEIKKPI